MRIGSFSSNGILFVALIFFLQKSPAEQAVSRLEELIERGRALKKMNEEAKQKSLDEMKVLEKNGFSPSAKDLEDYKAFNERTDKLLKSKDFSRNEEDRKYYNEVLSKLPRGASSEIDLDFAFNSSRSSREVYYMLVQIKFVANERDFLALRKVIERDDLTEEVRIKALSIFPLFSESDFKLQVSAFLVDLMKLIDSHEEENPAYLSTLKHWVIHIICEFLDENTISYFQSIIFSDNATRYKRYGAVMQLKEKNKALLDEVFKNSNTSIDEYLKKFK